MKDFWNKVVSTLRNSIEFLKETRKELNNVSWPSRRELSGTTVVVIVAVFFFGFFLYLVDLVVGFGMTYLYRLAGQ
jgi:preprotein translocase subunit SecE